MAKKSKSTNKKSSGGKKIETPVFKAEKAESVPIKALAKDERTWKIAGTVSLLISLFLIISFISYFFTWKQDFVQASRGSEILWDTDAGVNNLFRKTGCFSCSFFYI